MLLDARGGAISAGNAFEAAIVIDSYRDPVASRDLDRVRGELGIAIAPVTAAQVDIARQAYRDFGRGSGHPAKLDFGDCFAYALAVESGEPLLFVGDDFTHTDVEPALPPT
ncbi:MAG: putative pilT protein N-terminal, putative toxin of system [Thermoleophilia bacterium]|nr:putative pilT protein N-terminal, putative toxin of system [Thermoleophilia bacterium]